MIVGYILRNAIGYFLFRLNNKFRKIIGKHSRNQNCRRILNSNFKEGGVFNFIQIGGNDGISFDFLYDFVTVRMSNGIVLEPIPRYYEELKNNYSSYPSIKTINKAMHKDRSGLKLYAVRSDSMHKYPDWTKGIASWNKNHLVQNDIHDIDIQEVMVETITGNDVLQECTFLNSIDLLQIDTEGYDYKILLLFDLNKIHPKVIKFESVNLSEKEIQESLKLLRSLGYHYFQEIGDMVAIDKELIKMF